MGTLDTLLLFGAHILSPYELTKTPKPGSPTVNLILLAREFTMLFKSSSVLWTD